MALKLKKGDIVAVKSFALSHKDLVKVKLLKRVDNLNNPNSATGWDAQLIDSDDVEKLIKGGVPYKKDEKPKVWVFDFHIVRKIRKTTKTKSCKPKRKKLK
jgi:hypothetical protein